MKRASSLVLLPALLLACDPAARGIEGRMGHGDFTYICGTPADANCNGQDELFPSDRERLLPLAIGGSFDLVSDDDDFDVVAVEPELLGRSYGGVVFTAAGTTDFLAVSGDDTVLDIATLEAQPIAELGVFDAGRRVTTLDHDTFSFEIAAAPISPFGDVLGGGFQYEWTSTGDVTLRDDDDDNTVTVSVSSDGVGTITVRAAVWSTTVSVRD